MEELREKILNKLAELHEINSAFAFNTIEIDESDEWYECITDPDWVGKVPYGHFSNYLIFIEKKEDGHYLSLVCETEPRMIKDDWIFGNPLMPSGLEYDFGTGIEDVAVDYSHDQDEPVWVAKL